MIPVEPIVSLLWSDEPDDFAQAAELLRSVPELIGPVSVAAAGIDRLEQLRFLEACDPEHARSFSDTLSMRAAHRLLDLMRGSEQAVLYPFLDLLQAALSGEVPLSEASALAYRIAQANRQHDRVRGMVRLLLSTLDPLGERWEVWWGMDWGFTILAGEIAAHAAWEETWAAQEGAGAERSVVRETARAAREAARNDSSAAEQAATRCDVRELAPPVIHAMLTALTR
ncbi:MAG: hypothetical protein ACI8S6_003970 [Myxococcota bacterium]|jgi:hypothetical protein